LNGKGARLSVAAGEVVYDYRRDPDDLFAHVDPSLEMHTLTGTMLEGASHGRDAVRQWLMDVADYWESMWIEADQFVDAGDAAVVLGRVHGRGKKSGVAIEAPAAWVCRLRDARLSYWRFYFDHSSALKAVRLQE
jgi:ketosteroid isomerase-like protein